MTWQENDFACSQHYASIPTQPTAFPPSSFSCSIAILNMREGERERESQR
jgi:hypothetical protein